MVDKSTANSSHWAQVSEAGAASGMAFLFGCYRLGGRPLFAVFLVPVITYFFVVRGQARRETRRFLTRVNARRRAQLRPLPWYCFRVFWNFANALIDKFAVWLNKLTVDDVVVHRGEVIEELLAKRQGAVLLLSHHGNFEICRCLSGRHDSIKLTVVMHTKHAEKFNALLKRHIDDEHIDILQVTNINPATAMMLNERVARGEFLAIAADRVAVDHPQNSFVIDFLGQPARFPQGPFILASILKVPVVSIFCAKQAGRYHLEFEYLKRDTRYARQERKTQLLSLAETYSQRLEQHCLREPLQWFNFYDFWAMPEGQAGSSKP